MRLKEILNLKSLFFEAFKNNYFEGIRLFDYINFKLNLSDNIFFIILLFLANPYNNNKVKIQEEKIKIIKDLIYKAEAKEIKGNNNYNNHNNLLKKIK